MSAASKLIIVGAGGHAKVIIEAIKAAALNEIVALIAPNEFTTHVMGIQVFDEEKAFSILRAEGISNAVVAIGDNAMREKIADKLVALGFKLPTVVHPSATISPSAIIGEGAVIMAGSIVGTDTSVQRLVIINSGAVVDHDNVLGTASHVAPGSSLAGNVRVGSRTLIGVGSSVRPGISIGNDVVVGAGSAVVSNIKNRCVVVGVPARCFTRV